MTGLYVPMTGPYVPMTGLQIPVRLKTIDNLLVEVCTKGAGNQPEDDILHLSRAAAGIFNNRNLGLVEPAPGPPGN